MGVGYAPLYHCWSSFLSKCVDFCNSDSCSWESLDCLYEQTQGQRSISPKGRTVSPFPRGIIGIRLGRRCAAFPNAQQPRSLFGLGQSADCARATGGRIVRSTKEEGLIEETRRTPALALRFASQTQENCRTKMPTYDLPIVVESGARAGCPAEEKCCRRRRGAGRPGVYLSIDGVRERIRGTSFGGAVRRKEGMGIRGRRLTWAMRDSRWPRPG